MIARALRSPGDEPPVAHDRGRSGVALGVSNGFIFLFVVRRAARDGGAGNYFIRCDLLLGHMRGGPAKAAVVASASTGLISAVDRQRGHHRAPSPSR